MKKLLIKFIYLFLLIITLNSCSGTKEYSNGEYLGELSFPFVGSPEGNGIFTTYEGDSYEGNFSSKNFVGKVNLSDKSVFDGKIEGDIFLNETKKNFELQFDGIFKETDWITKTESYTVKYKTGKLSSLNFNGTIESDTFKFNGQTKF